MWQWLSDPDNQKTLALLGGGVATLAGAAWALFKFLRRKQAAPRAEGAEFVAAAPNSTRLQGEAATKAAALEEMLAELHTVRLATAPMVQCRNGHHYDDRKHTHCPYCPVPGLKDVTIPVTQAAPMGRPGVPPTEPASALRGTGAPIRPGMPQTEPASPRGSGAPIRGGGGMDRGGTPGVTIGIFQKHTGMDPVVGWLVCIKGTNKGRDYRLHSDLNKLGRAPNMDVCIEGDEAIARENHCQPA
jgi:hypothetical protein